MTSFTGFLAPLVRVQVLNLSPYDEQFFSRMMRGSRHLLPPLPSSEFGTKKHSTEMAITAGMLRNEKVSTSCDHPSITPCFGYGVRMEHKRQRQILSQDPLDIVSSDSLSSAEPTGLVI